MPIVVVQLTNVEFAASTGTTVLTAFRSAIKPSLFATYLHSNYRSSFSVIFDIDQINAQKKSL
jgi:hypothetical protein